MTIDRPLILRSRAASRRAALRVALFAAAIAALLALAIIGGDAVAAWLTAPDRGVMDQ